MAESAKSRTWFGQVVVAGLATAALTSVASGKAWFVASVDDRLLPGVPETDTRADMPLALALSLVVLAGWGAVLVTRGRLRRAVTTLALVAAVGVLVCLVIAPFTLPGDVRDQLLPGTDDVAIDPTAWYLTAAVAGPLAVASLVAAWVLVPRWPAMSTRYDAPAAREPAAAAEARTDADLWKALDEGDDPTDPTPSSKPSSP